MLEVTEDEAEVPVRVGEHIRHPVVAAGIPESILFIKGSIPPAFRQLVTLLFEDEGRALRAGVDGLLSCQERHALLRSGRAVDDLLERANAEFVAGLQDSSRIREVFVGDVIVVVIEFFTILLTECREPLFMHIVVGHRDDAEVHE